MSSLNQVTILGRMGRDPEVRNTNNGNAIANLNIATTETWKDKATGERQEKSEWHRVVCFGHAADIASKYLAKGSQVLVQGKLTTRKWTDAQGVEKYTTEVVVENFGGKIVLVGSKGDTQSAPQVSAPKAAPDSKPPFDDEIPF
jgi:single-strand DNA-binding protein